METKEKEVELCGIHNWVSSIRCQNEAGFYTLTYLPADKEFNRTADDTETVKLCDDCYEELVEYYEHLVNTIKDIKTTDDIVVKYI